MTIDGPKPACNADMCDHCARKAKRLNAERRALTRMKRAAVTAKRSGTHVVVWKPPVRFT